MTSLFQHCGKAPLTSSFRVVLPVFLSQMGNSPLGWGGHTCMPLFCLEGAWFCFLFGLLPPFCYTFSQYKDQSLESSSRIEIRWIFASTSTYWLIHSNCNHIFGPRWKKPNKPTLQRPVTEGRMSPFFWEKKLVYPCSTMAGHILPVGRNFPSCV